MHIKTRDDDDDDDNVVKDGDSVSVPMFLRDGETIPELHARIARTQTLGDAYQQFVADREAWRAAQYAELRAIAQGTPTRAFTAALDARDAAWAKRGEDQSRAWQRPAAVAEAKSPATSGSLNDALAARDAAWAKRGERQAAAWRRE